VERLERLGAQGVIEEDRQLDSDFWRQTRIKGNKIIADFTDSSEDETQGKSHEKNPNMHNTHKGKDLKIDLNDCAARRQTRTWGFIH
jgi:hypothetical protein